MPGLVDATHFLPAEDPLRTVVERWACWGWTVADAIRDQEHPSAMIGQLERWMNGPDVSAAYRAAGALAYRGRHRMTSQDIAPFRRVQWGAPRPPARPEPAEIVGSRMDQVALLLGQGYSQKQIAKELRISAGRVSALASRVWRKAKADAHENGSASE